EGLKNVFGVYLPMKNTSDEWVFKQGDICSLTIEEKATIANANPEAIQILKALGIKFNLYIKLKIGGKVIGVQQYHFADEKVVTDRSVTLAKSITDLIAMAVANILANEEIQKRENEKAQLLRISEAIATIKNYKELLYVIYKVIQPIFHFHNTGIFVTDKRTGNIFEVTDSEILQGRVAATFTEAKVSGPFSKADFQQQSWVHTLTPMVTNLEKEKKYIKNAICKEQFELSIAAGLQEMICGPLHVGGERIGAMYFSTKQSAYYTEDCLPLFKSITDFVAISVGNILANEEILEREKEKTMLLSISEAVATIRDKKDLLKFVFERVKPLFGFYDAGFFVFSEDKQYIDDWTVAMPETSPSSTNYQIAASKSSFFPFHSSALEPFYQQLRKTESPAIAHYDADWFAQNADYPQRDAIRDAGHKESIGTLLRTNAGDLGILFFNSLTANHFSEAQFSLFQGIADQLATAVANILANEGILKREKEIAELNKQLKVQNEYLIEEVEQQYNFEEMIGLNIQFSEVVRNITMVAKTESTVLVLGETGTGKELVARAIHNNSTRKNKPLIKLNCAALPANLIESELFGHERGAFTGAIERRIGKFELANGSTLFLDEVGELPLELQSKLLRALQEKEIERLGSNKTLKVDVRIIAATNRELEKEVQAGKFRQDLFYRLHIFPIILPPLRERKEDIPLLAAHFIERYAKKIGKRIQGLDSKAMQEMMSYNWPGNIRELEHVIERSVILAKSKFIQQLNLPLQAKQKTSTSTAEFIIKSWEDQERDYILEVLKFTKGNMAGKGGAAELLQLPPTTLQSKMKKLGIKRKHFSEKREG
ncbi:MAG TPA: sigma 54-interacting transcriptional regulator, partial [Chitinophagaceae bacterium]|nr:sigma 54-interacting transcriptional regulator [Chitinophagaceae bacterium]